MLEHSYRIIEMRYGENREKCSKDLIIDFAEPKYDILTIFLSSEVVCFEEWIKESFGKVLSGESKFEDGVMNMCDIEISPTTTKVYNALAEDGMGNWCEVDTKELRMLIDEWCEKYDEFKKKYRE